MERFLKFKENVSLKSLAENISDKRIIILRESKTTGTIQVKFPDNISVKRIKESFQPYTVTKIYKEFPYPTSGDKFLGLPLLKIKKIFASL